MKRKLTILVIFIIIIIGSGLRAYGNWKTAIYNTDISTSAYESVDEIYNNTVIKQGFYCKYNGLSGFSIRVATYDWTNTSYLLYHVKEKKSGNIVAEGTISTEELKTNSFNEISFSKIDNSKDKEYILEIQDDNAKTGNGITIFKTEPGDLAGKLVVNDEEITNQALVVKVITHRFNIEYFIVFISLMLYIILFIKLLNKFLK